VHRSHVTCNCRELCLANIASGQKSLTLASPLGTLRAMRDVFETGATARSARATRRDLLLETLALRHQLGVLARSNRRFRPSDRLVWLIFRWMWPRWTDALLLVQPATVDRWHRDGFHRRSCLRSRRPGRPCIDSSCRDLIGRLAEENRLWGAPRIHGELLKLGVVVSERTVSRYLRGRPRRPSQTWRTFLANHLADLPFISPAMSSSAPGDDVVDVSAVACRSTPLSDGLSASSQCVVIDWPASVRRTFLGLHIAHGHLHDCTGMPRSIGRAPPTHG
jgi:hypothetical protein